MTGIDGFVKCALGDGDDLYAGGWFWAAGEVVTGNVARWDGEQWHPFGYGISIAPDVIPQTLAVYHEDLWCDGYRWNSDYEYWSQRTETNNAIRDLEVYDDLLAGGGGFASPVTVWTGASWERLGSILELNDVFYRCLAVHDETLRLVALGDPDGWWQAKIATWNGEGWEVHEAGEIVDAATEAVIHEGTLFVSGQDIYDWSDPAEPVLMADIEDGGIGWRFIPWNDLLVVGGFFGSIEGVPAVNIAMGDATGWHPLGSGCNSHVMALARIIHESPPAEAQDEI